LTFIVSVALLLKRWGELKSEGEMTSMFSREALFTLNNLLFILILFVCFWGVIYPLISEIVTGQKVTFGPEWYERITGPLFAGLLLLMGVAPLSAWKYSTARTLGKAAWKPFLISLAAPVIVVITGMRQPFAILGLWLCAFAASVTLYEFWRGAMARRRMKKENLFTALWRLAGRDRRRYGGYIIHLGVVLMAIGIIGIEMFQTETQATVPQGGTITLGDYTVTYKSLAVFDTPDGRNVARAVLSVEKDGKFVGELYPRRDFFFESQQPMTIPGVRSTMEDDLYVLLIDWMPVSSQGASFKIYHNPLVNWLWLGGIVFILGTLVAAWPDKDPEEAVAPARRSTYAGAEA
jgi:cytochrome c-type biogenesis protein CcmF